MDSWDSLESIYGQVEQSVSSLAVLGLDDINSPTPAQIKTAYKALALILHPDRCQSHELRDQHKTLFHKVQNAYDELISGSGSQHGNELLAGYLQESALAHHARVLGAKEALQNERSTAVPVVRAEKEKAQAKREKLAERVKQGHKLGKQVQGRPILNLKEEKSKARKSALEKCTVEERDEQKASTEDGPTAKETPIRNATGWEPAVELCDREASRRIVNEKTKLHDGKKKPSKRVPHKVKILTER